VFLPKIASEGSRYPLALWRKNIGTHRDDSYLCDR
jgi:hypothetical protein